MANPSVDASARHAVFVERLAATNANTLDPELRGLAAFIRSRLAEEGSTIPSKKAMDSIVKDAQNQYMAVYSKWEKQTDGFLKDLSKYETGFQTDILDAETTDDFTPVKPKNKTSESNAKNQPLMIAANGGAVALSSLVGNFAKNETAKVTGLIKTGYYQGRSTSEISASIAGTKKNNFRDGIMVNAKRNATNISKTSANHISTTASDTVYKENEKAVKGYILTAVLDSATSKTCRGLDDTRVAFDDDYKPKPPFHFHCRTTTRPWLREDLDAIKLAERQTKGADGKEFEHTGKQYYSWLKQQPSWFQDDILGKTEGKIFRNAGLTPNEFKSATIKRDGTPLNISEMAEKDVRIKSYLLQGK